MNQADPFSIESGLSITSVYSFGADQNLSGKSRLNSWKIVTVSFERSSSLLSELLIF